MLASGSGSVPFGGPVFMSRAFSDEPSRTMGMQTSSDMMRGPGLNSFNSGDGLSWTPKSAPLGLAPQPARRKHPSLSASGSDRSSGEAGGAAPGGVGIGGFETPRKAPFNLLTPPVEQRGSFPSPPSPAAPVLSPTDLLAPPLRDLTSPGSGKQGSSWPASNESDGKKDHMSSTRRSSDLERQDEEDLQDLQNFDEAEPDDGTENDVPWRASDNRNRASFAEMSLNNPRDRSIELSDSDGDHVRRAAAALTGNRFNAGPASATGAGSDRGSHREPSIRSLAVSIEDADEDDLRRVIDARGFARPAATTNHLSKEEKFQRALSLRAVDAAAASASAQQKGASAPGAVAAASKGLGLAPPSRGGAQAESEASFGAAEISHNPRLQRLDSMGRKPRTNPFWPYQRRTPGQTKLTPDDRQESDQSGESGPSQVTGITGSSGGTSGTSGSGSGSGNSRSTGPSYDLRTHAQRVGVGERGGAPSPIKQISSKKLAAAATAAAGHSAQARPSTSSSGKRPQQTKKSKASNHSTSDGGRSGDSNGTFGMRSTDRPQPQMPM